MLGVLCGATTARVLEALVFAVEPVHLRELARRAGIAPIEASRVLDKLTKAKLVERKKTGNMVFFSLNRLSTEGKLLTRLVEETRGVIPALKTILLKEKNVRIAFVYGSFASETAGPKSDVDVIIVGKPDLTHFAGEMGELGIKFGKEINYSVFAPEEFEAKKKSPFLSRVLAEEKVMLVGKIGE